MDESLIPSAAVAAEDRERLVDAMLVNSTDQIKKHGSFVPFGAAITVSGDLELSMSDGGSDEMEQGLIEGMAGRARSGEIRGAAVCTDVWMTEPESGQRQDAIRFVVEQVGEDPVECYLPYRRGRLGRTSFGELIETGGESQVLPR